MPATTTRAHDLPPRWDGHAVLWEGWERDDVVVFICPPPKVPAHCHRCGSIETPLVNRGLVAVWISLTHEDLQHEEDNRRRLGSLAHKRKPRARRRLRAYRCPDCHHDQVWDLEDDHDGPTGTWWDLDATDYGETGSEPPQPETLW